MTKSRVIQIDTQATADKLVAKWKKALKQAHGYIGNVTVNVAGNSIEVIIETNLPEWLKDEMEMDARRTEFCRVTGSAVYAGQFDWAADTYIKDAAMIYIDMHPTY